MLQQFGGEPLLEFHSEKAGKAVVSTIDDNKLVWYADWIKCKIPQ